MDERSHQKRQSYVKKSLSTGLLQNMQQSFFLGCVIKDD